MVDPMRRRLTVGCSDVPTAARPAGVNAPNAEEFGFSAIFEQVGEAEGRELQEWLREPPLTGVAAERRNPRGNTFLSERRKNNAAVPAPAPAAIAVQASQGDPAEEERLRGEVRQLQNENEELRAQLASANENIDEMRAWLNYITDMRVRKEAYLSTAGTGASRGGPGEEGRPRGTGEDGGGTPRPSSRHLPEGQETRRRLGRCSKQSGVPNVHWSAANKSWRVMAQNRGQRTNKHFPVRPFISYGRSYEEADQAALEAAIDFRATLAKRGALGKWGRPKKSPPEDARNCRVRPVEEEPPEGKEKESGRADVPFEATAKRRRCSKAN